MKRFAKQLVIVIAAVVLLAESAPAKPENPVPWREQYAYSLGIAAYPYVFPYLNMTKLRWMWTTQPRDPLNTPYMPLNHFWHATRLSNAKYRDGGKPNNDTLYSVAWVNVDKEPIILSYPDMGDRYFAFELTDFTSDNFGYAGQRVTGSAAGHFAIVSEDFKGDLPPGVKALPAAPTPWIFILGRTLVDGEQDLPNVLALQKQYRLTPLSYWGKPDAELPVSHDIWAPYKQKEDPLARWRTINRAMAENPPPSNESELLSLLAEIHIGPGQDLDTLDEDSKRGLARAAKDAHKMMILARSNPDHTGGVITDGWRRGNNLGQGRAGKYGQYLRRGLSNFKGICGNDPEEAKYFQSFQDKNGKRLDAGETSYELTFPKGEEPPADAFWSITMYDKTTNLVDNPIDRYSIGDRTRGLKRSQDGSLTIYIQTESPGKNKASNWLPAPDGRFRIALRVYRPQQAALDGSWLPPALKVKEK
ncbi:MAG: DUF1254 domain-containing protein [Deltaproteobacteria bacterium]|nr:DUF1254 domain-containing protein [Deltaproteobacteria bacterium]